MSNPLAMCISKLSGPMKKMAWERRAADSRMVCFPAKRKTLFELRFLVISELDDGEIARDGIDKINPMINRPIFDTFFASCANGDHWFWD